MKHIAVTLFLSLLTFGCDALEAENDAPTGSADDTASVVGCSTDADCSPAAPVCVCEPGSPDCTEGYCAPACVPQCDGRECGDDECGGTCGTCETETDSCDANGQCQCEPVCEGECGNDSCGGIETCGQCDDGEACVTDERGRGGICEAVSVGCEAMDDGMACDDGDLCTVGDQCSAGVCIGAAMDCSALDLPCEVGTCAPETGECVSVPAVDGASCDDGTLCTEGDQCVEGDCIGEPVECPAGGPCTNPSCDPDGGCLFVPAPEGSACEDGSACTELDACDNVGECVGQPVVCEADDNVCTLELCDADIGCTSIAEPDNFDPCDDGNPETFGDACDGLGSCVGVPYGCGDGIVAELEQCDDGNTTSGDGCAPDCTVEEGWTCTGSPSACCEQLCDGKSCGSDGCGGSCGVCGPTESCSNDGQCVCTPSCQGKTCGEDGCGGQCGTCADNEVCSVAGSCVCVPDCSGKDCGDDGCGDTCGSCADNESCEEGTCAEVVETVDVNFSVDMGCSGLDSFTTVYVTGPWANWCGDCFALSDDDSDGIWTGSFPFEVGTTVEYKFLVDNWADQEVLYDDMAAGASCAPITDYYSYGNRQVVAEEGASTVDTYGSCAACGTEFPGVAFSVDMNCSGLDAFTTVYVTGPWANWCGDCYALSDEDGDGVWSTTLVLEPGTVVEYKYMVDNWAASEDLVEDMVNGGSCAPVTDYYEYANRTVTVPEGAPISVSDVYGSCFACDCEGSCDGLECGGDGCGNSCGLCDEGLSCEQGQCVSLPACDPPCGDGETCGEGDVCIPDGPKVCEEPCGEGQICVEGECVATVLGCTDEDASNYVIEANEDDASCVYEVSLDLGGVSDCGFVSATGTWDGWTGWGTTTDNDLKIELAPGDYQFIILCVDTNIPNWWDNIWGAATILRPEPSCAANDEGEPNYGLTVLEEPATFSFCAGTCEAKCPEDEVPGCTDPGASNHAPAATSDDGSCQYEVTFDIDGVADCGYVSITGTWDSWSGWGAHTDSDFTTVMTPGDYEFVILCVDTNTPDWAADIWGASTVLRPTLECAANDQGALNYGFSLDAQPTTVSYCAGTCEATCGDPTIEDVPGCTNDGAANHNPEATLDDGSCLYEVTFNLGGVEECGFLSVTGTWDSWSGWGAHTDTEMKATLAPGDYEFIVLCVDNTVDGWWDNIWGHATILRPEPECAANAEGEPNYGFTVSEQAATVSFCAGTCEAECEGAGGEDVLGCTNVAASNHNPEATQDDGSCLYQTTFNLGAVEDCGFVSVTGTFDDWSGWGANTDTDMKVDLASGDYEFVILCVDTSVDGWWNDIWSNATVLRPEPECAANVEGEPNYGFSVNGEPVIFDFCAGTCEAQCDDEDDIEDVPGCTDEDAANYATEATVDDGTCLYDVIFAIDGMADCGFTSVTGTFDGWTGWGANENNDDKVALASGDYEFVILCVDTTIPNWWDNIWGAATVLRPEPDCTANDSGDPNYGFTVANAPQVVSVCAGTCEEKCNAGQDIPGCTDASAANFNVSATVDDGTCTYDVIFDFGGVENCGFLTATGTWDGWSGWGINSDNNMTGAFEPGDYEFVILCVDTTIPNWWDNIWGAATVLRPTDDCKANTEGDPNYGFTVGQEPLTVSYCAGSCDEVCAPVDYAVCKDAAGRPNPVTIQGRNLVIDGEPTHLKGVAWSPTDLGQGPGTGPDPFALYVETDAPLMAAAGINVVRTYGPIYDTAVLDTLYDHGIYVLMTVYYGYSETPQSTVEKVCELKSHPAIIGWLVGNEWNYNNLGLDGAISFTEAVDRVADATEAIKQNDDTRPVSTIYGGIPDAAVYAALSGVDVWGLNVYTGASFGDLFDSWQTLSDKPMYFGEYGADAYNGVTNSVDETMQAELLASQTQEIYANAAVTGGVCAGGTVFEWNDEWWKYSGGSWSEHDTQSSWDNGAYPDPGMHEEWWGIVDIDRTPRQAYQTYAGMAAPTYVP